MLSLPIVQRCCDEIAPPFPVYELENIFPSFRFKRTFHAIEFSVEEAVWARTKNEIFRTNTLPVPSLFRSIFKEVRLTGTIQQLPLDTYRLPSFLGALGHRRTVLVWTYTSQVPSVMWTKNWTSGCSYTGAEKSGEYLGTGGLELWCLNT